VRKSGRDLRRAAVLAAEHLAQWEIIDYASDAKADVPGGFRGRGVYRKVTPEAGVEAATLTWLRDHGVPVADVVDVGPDWLVTREIAGQRVISTMATAARPNPTC
jgi:hypothetical protein